MGSFPKLTFLASASSSQPYLLRGIFVDSAIFPLVGFITSDREIPPVSCNARLSLEVCAMSSSVAPPSVPASNTNPTGYLNAAYSAALDADLMTKPGFSLEQIMELAGLSVAEAVNSVAPSEGSTKKRQIFIVCGPGNNGGDGLVEAWHLVLLGYEVGVVYPKRSKKEDHYADLVQQCGDVGLDILDEIPPESAEGRYDIIVDAIFGFSFKGESR